MIWFQFPSIHNEYLDVICFPANSINIRINIACLNSNDLENIMWWHEIMITLGTILAQRKISESCCFRNVGYYLPIDTALHPRRLVFSATPLCAPPVAHICIQHDIWTRYILRISTLLIHGHKVLYHHVFSKNNGTFFRLLPFILVKTINLQLIA